MAIRPFCLPLLLGLAACSPSPAAICSRFAEDCGWDNEECVDDIEDFQTAAANAGCDAESDEYLRCLAEADTTPCQAAFCVPKWFVMADCIANAPSEP